MEGFGSMLRNPWKMVLPAIVIAAIAGFLLATRLPRFDAAVDPARAESSASQTNSAKKISSAPLPQAHTAQLKKITPPQGAIRNEMLLRFGNAAAMQKFLDQAARAGARVLGIIPGLNAVRIGFDTPEKAAEIRALAPDSAEVGFNYVAALPGAPDPAKQDPGGPYVAFGSHALDWLGVPANNETWGAGVKVAVLDTGIIPVPGLTQKSITTLDLTGQAGGISGDLRHGTAMASIIASDSPDAPGIAPAAQLLSIAVLDGNGTGDSFTVAQGIMDAVDSGARVISMSLGSEGDSSILRDAVEYALAHNVAIVAAVGNEGTGSVSYPARYPGVIGVTAVDANGQRAQFANYGEGVAIAAPGIGVYTPWTSDTVLNSSGTSPAVPFVSGALTAILSQNPGMSVQTATSLLLQYANDAGAPGTDPMYGTGILNLDRVINRNQAGINDAAVADVYYGTISGQGETPVLAVTVQNRGTTSLYNVELNVTAGGQTRTFYFNALGTGEVKSGIVPVNPVQLQSGVDVSSRVTLDGVQDAKPANDTKSVVLKTKSTTGQ